METNDTNIFGNLKNLIWGAFVSVVSFQLIAPQIWSYLHDLLGIGYSSAYYCFTVVYFSALPVSIIVWLWLNKNTLRKFLPDFNSNQMNLKVMSVCISFLVILFLQLCVTLAGFFIWHWGNTTPYFILILYFTINIFFIVVCRLYSCKFIEHANLEKPKKDKIEAYFKTNFSLYLLVCIVGYVIAFMFITNWITADHYRIEQRSFVQSNKGFTLQKVTETIDKSIRVIDKVEHMASETESNKKVGIGTTFSKKRFQLDTLLFKNMIIHKLDTIEYLASLLDSVDFHTNKIIGKDKLLGVSYTIPAINHKIDSVTYSLNTHLDSNLFTRGLCIKDSGKTMLKYMKAQLILKKEKLTDKAKQYLGVHLRSVQAKGMIMLLSIFLTIFSLHLYIGLIEKSQKLEYEDITKVKPGSDLAVNIEETSGDSSNMRRLSEEELRENIDSSVYINSRLWIILTVTAWLLIPIFKPIKDKDINIDAPYMNATAADDIKGKLPGKDTSRRVVKILTDRHDTIHVDTVSIDTSKNLQLDLNTLTKKVERIDETVNKIKNTLIN